jgi:hypothetical protein
LAELTLALGLAVPTGVNASSWSADARLSAGAGVDSNARRDYQQLGPQADAVASLIGTAQLHWLSERGQADAGYQLGLRKFLRLAAEDTLVQSGSAQGTWWLARAWGLGAEGFIKDRRGGDRDYSDLSGSGLVQFAPDASFDLRLRGGGHRFVYRPNFAYSFRATELGLQGRYRFDRRHSLSATGELGFRSYNSTARPDPRLESPPALEQRQDLALLAGLAYNFRGPFALTLAYNYGQAASNSFGESLYRHRLSAAVALRLPLQLTLLGEAALQFTRYPDGPYPTPDVILIEDDNYDSLSVKLLRPVTKHVDVELHYALYHTELPQNALTYLRQVAWIGFTWRL